MNDNRLNVLIDGCRQFNRSSQKSVYQQFYRYVLSVASRYVSTKDEAREVANDVFYQVFTKIDRYNSAQPFKPWLHVITVRCAIDYFRKFQRAPQFSDDLEELTLTTGADNILAAIEVDELLTLVQSLPPAYRMAINLYAIEGYGHPEIASMLGISEGTSKSNLFKARVKLKEMLVQQNFIKSGDKL